MDVITSYSIHYTKLYEEERTGRNVLPGAVYTIMERLRDRGLVASYTGDATPERGGRRRKHYRLLPAGEVTLARAYGQRNNFV